ncbi:MAG: hypothetical protein ACPGYT_06370, partial [Nitrospirales bacterium]
SRLAMSGASLGTIAALLRHSTTVLVKRYAHLSPAYMKEAVEDVSKFGKGLNVEGMSLDAEGAQGSFSDGTVTVTGMLAGRGGSDEA